ncbi:MAG TPA: twin-arginine translocase subunit TatC [Planctomycetota bacterium]|nr:twin-arginine translocase subunit TatC [Planctomycetota bacterium]
MELEAEGRMSLAEHLDELRRRLLRSIAALVLAIGVAFAFYRTLLDVATLPHFKAMEWCGLARAHSRLILCSYGPSVLAIAKLAFVVGFFAASPYIVREVWAFVAAGLRPQEKKYVVRFAPLSFLLFILGGVFGYFILIPYALYGMVQMMPAHQVQPLVDLGGYLNLVMTLTLVLGAVFQLPLVMVFLTQVGVVRASSWSAWRRPAIIANVLLAAVLSPPDVLSMIAFAIPLLGLYEIGAAVSRWVAGRAHRARPRA